MAESAYRLFDPDYRKYAPTALEQIYAQKVGDPSIHPGFYQGHMLEAQGDARRAQQAYEYQLGLTNQRQQQIANAKIAAELEETQGKDFRQALQFPAQVSTFSRGQRLVAPGMEDHAVQLGVADLANTNAESYQRYMTGANQGSEAGMHFAPGTIADPVTGAPSAPPRMTSPRDVQVAGINAGATLGAARIRSASDAAGWNSRDADRLGDSLSKIEERRVAEIARLERAFLTGEMQIRDRNGNLLVPGKLDPTQQAFLRNRIDELGEAAAHRQFEQYKQTYGGIRNVPMPPNPYRAPRGAADAQPERNVGDGGGSTLGINNRDTNRRAPTDDTVRPLTGSAADASGGNAGVEVDPGATRVATRLKQLNVQNGDAIAQRALQAFRRHGGKAYRYYTKPDGTVEIHDAQRNVLEVVR